MPISETTDNVLHLSASVVCAVFHHPNWYPDITSNARKTTQPGGLSVSSKRCGTNQLKQGRQLICRPNFGRLYRMSDQSSFIIHAKRQGRAESPWYRHRVYEPVVRTGLGLKIEVNLTSLLSKYVSSYSYDTIIKVGPFHFSPKSPFFKSTHLLGARTAVKALSMRLCFQCYSAWHSYRL